MANETNTGSIVTERLGCPDRVSARIHAALQDAGLDAKIIWSKSITRGGSVPTTITFWEHDRERVMAIVRKAVAAPEIAENRVLPLSVEPGQRPYRARWCSRVPANAIGNSFGLVLVVCIWAASPRWETFALVVVCATIVTFIAIAQRRGRPRR